MLSHAQIEHQINELYKHLAYWQKQAEEDIKAQNWNGIAATNCTIINSKINALQFVLGSKPLLPVYDNAGYRYSLQAQ